MRISSIYRFSQNVIHTFNRTCELFLEINRIKHDPKKKDANYGSIYLDVKSPGKQALFFRKAEKKLYTGGIYGDVLFIYA